VQIVEVRRALASGAARRIREHADLSLAEMAKGVPVDPSTLWRWETGRQCPRGAAALRYAALLEVVAKASAPSDALAQGA